MADVDTVPTAHPIRDLRRSLRLTQAQLASAVGVSRQTIVAVEQGDYAPSVFLALRLARELGATVESLFGHQLESSEHRSGT
ncbi:helix-turn-helix transcriptional regulator [Nesterenkonia aerolata]|uniref:Helix-turn-helix transcriptional regulator n=1 Tax=Nesterenkonia aerolata TaxID=3074079 RepID=A0ABU2DPH6_9MICC|nr:helix-turn-helix transcriptional regulator [Nesterenkonia sp. LY-0111]MDR8018414.1 helix-turn-helix transcriptional regulator [Nesterenkonia sp. LY-0111]